jgi:hypothetical protein
MSSNPPVTGGVGSFEAPDTDQIPYQLQALNPDGSAFALTSTQRLSLLSNDGNSTVVPDPNDPSGLTGDIVAAAGFVGPVGGTLAFTDSANPGFSLAGTWKGQFDAASQPPNEPMSIQVTFATPIPAAQQAQAQAKKAK